MTQIFDDAGNCIPVTLVNAAPCRVTRVKTSESSDGYNSVVLGMPGRKKLSKTHLGQIKELGNLQYIKEFKTEELNDLKKGRYSFSRNI